MKRSKMLTDLSAYLRASQDDFYDFAENNMSLGKLLSIISTKCLNFVEDRGMLPPLKDDSAWIEINGTLKRIENEWDEEER